ncbi:hypothetical protein [Actinoplanes philippinensis]|uniref:hypothetical protein n=1 Tax=Actinoplanes philippinensis TaxID=35752 RepID=UPI0033E5FE65
MVTEPATDTTAVVSALFTGPAPLTVPVLEERTSYKKKGSSDTAHTKDEIVT